MMVPFLDVGAAYRELSDDIDAAVGRVLRRGWFVLGDEGTAFEQEWADYVGAAHCVGVSNGLDALRLTLLGLGIGPGDEVIVPSHTFIATWLAVSHVGATPVAVEPVESTYNLDAGRLAAAITDRTRAVIPVHLYGQPADLDAIAEVIGDRDIAIVEDAAQAHGARYKSRRVGALGRAAAWSFYPAKNLGAIGDAGAITTDDPELAQRLREWRNYGSSSKYQHDIRGYNNRLDEVQAAVLRVKLHHLDTWNTRRAQLAATYMSDLTGLDVRLPTVPEWTEPVWHLFVVRTPNRDSLRRHLAASGIESGIHYPTASHSQQAYADLPAPRGSLPVAEALADEVLSLPIGPHLDAAAVASVCEAVRSWRHA